MKSVVRHEVFGNPERPTLYYLTGYGGTIKKMRPHIAVLNVFGFRVVAFEYDKAILNGGDPSILLASINEIEQIVKADAESHRPAGIYGMSLGGFIGFNILKRTDIRRAIFNTGGVSILNTVWHNPHLADEKQAFEKAGFSYEAMAKSWYDIDQPHKLSGKKVLLMISDADKVLSPTESRSNFQHWTEAGVEGKLIASSLLRHGAVIVRNLFRVSRTVRFFKPDSNE